MEKLKIFSKYLVNALILCLLLVSLGIRITAIILSVMIISLLIVAAKKGEVYDFYLKLTRPLAYEMLNLKKDTFKDKYIHTRKASSMFYLLLFLYLSVRGADTKIIMGNGNLSFMAFIELLVLAALVGLMDLADSTLLRKANDYKVYEDKVKMLQLLELPMIIGVVILAGSVFIK